VYLVLMCKPARVVEQCKVTACKESIGD